MADTQTHTGATVHSHARIATLPNKSRTYMIQMCKHFGHKVEAKFDDTHGRIALGERVCELEVSAPDVLRISLTADNEASLHAIEDVVDRHLRRFAFKEELTIQWVEGA
ncbi:MAG: DUF2218 domain-containing protein [Hyphomonadaceae bacterium]